nr:THAP domain-containing protein 1-like [Leptinotarsa decemlineata]
MVQCSVLVCFNNSANKNKALSSVTFHRFPKNIKLRNMWVEATRRLDWAPPKDAVICSVHFEESCLYTTPKGQHKVIEGSIPTKLLLKVESAPSTLALTQNESMVVPHIKEEPEEEPQCSVQSFISTSNEESSTIVTTHDDMRRLSDSDSPETKKLKLEILRLDSVLDRQRRNLKRLWQKNRRQSKKISSLQEMFLAIEK